MLRLIPSRDRQQLLRQIFAEVPALKPLFLRLTDDISPVYFASTYFWLSTRNYGGDFDSRKVLGYLILIHSWTST